MKYFAILFLPLFILSCTGESEEKNTNVNNDSVVLNKNVKDSLALTEQYITGNWKLVWIAGDSLKITPKMRMQLMNVKVFFKFNADKSYFYIQNKSTVKGSWKISGNELCIRIGSAKNDQCTSIKIIDADKFSFPYKYSKDLEAEVTLSRVL